MFRHRQNESNDHWDDRVQRNAEAYEKVDTQVLQSQGDAIYDFERVPAAWLAVEEDRKPCGEAEHFTR